jgi:hypothetical protein
MTNLLDNSEVLQKQDGEDLGIKLAGFQTYINECQNFVKSPDNMSEILSQSTEQDGSPFQNFKKNIKKRVFSHIDKAINSQVVQNKDFVKTMLSHHLSQQKAKSMFQTLLSYPQLREQMRYPTRQRRMKNEELRIENYE